MDGKGNYMKCPYCNTEMVLGALYSGADRAVYWLPAYAERDFSFLGQKQIEKRDGVILDQITKVGFLAKERPSSYYCKTCKVILTQVDKE